jgi:hypothetical protein
MTNFGIFSRHVSKPDVPMQLSRGAHFNGRQPALELPYSATVQSVLGALFLSNLILRPCFRSIAAPPSAQLTANRPSFDDAGSRLPIPGKSMSQCVCISDSRVRGKMLLHNDFL